MNANHDARVFCVFDWDTVYGSKTRLESHRRFEEQFETEISDGRVTLCPSMPCIEYWFLLHFVDHSEFLRAYSSVANRLAQYMKRLCFPDEKQALKKLLKMEKYLKNSTWVERLCADGKLDLGKERAENNITAALRAGNLDTQSYSYVYKVFKD